MSQEIPFRCFSGQVKQLETQFNLPLMREFFEPCFSAFDDLDKLYAELRRQRIEEIRTAAGVELNFGYRPRRFSGGPGLPPGRYFALCDGGNFNDRGTLRDEVTAYYSEASGMTVLIFDPKVEPSILDYLRTDCGMSEEDLAYPFYYFAYRIERRTEKSAPLLPPEGRFNIGHGIGVTYGVREFNVEIERVVDLRDPETQTWFVETFVGLELQNEERAANDSSIALLPKQPIRSFGEMLPVLVSLETGGGIIFGQAVGQWLRRNNVNGLIFPSARSNAFSKVRNGTPTEWAGWNLVVYAGAEHTVPGNLFGRMHTWRDRDHDHILVDYTGQGSETGSFSVRGVREFNLLDFDLKKQVACGVREDNVFAGLTGLRNEALSRAVKAILERERVEREQVGGALWYQDVDYIDFIKWHEKIWRNPLGEDSHG